MNNKYKIVGLIILLTIILSLAIPFVPGELFNKPVYAAAGTTTVNITATQYTFVDSTPALVWFEKLGQTSCDSITVGGGVQAGWYSSLTSQKFDSLQKGLLRFDLSSIPAGVEVISARIICQLRNSGTTSYWMDDYVGMFRTTVAGSVPVVSEWRNANFLVNPVASIIPYSELTTSMVGYTFNIFQGDLSYVLTPQSGNYTWVAWVTGYDMWNIEADWHSWLSHWTQMNSTPCYLQVTYATEAAERIMHEETNAAEYTGMIYGTENVSGISWATPRAAFADEKVGFRFEGSPGASFNYRILSSSGETIITGNNTIKTDNYFYTYTEIPITFSGWLRATATDNLSNVRYSSWGRVEPPPNDNQRLLTVSAVDTEYPQYDYEFKQYVIYKDGIGYIYWKTNLETADMANYSLKIMAGGNEAGSTSFNATMQWLNENYFQTVDTDNYDQAHWRYLAFTPYVSKTGFNSYDGFIINVGKDYTLTQCGFWQGAIRKNSDNSTLTWTDSAYFYLNSLSQGVSISLDSSTVKPATDMKAEIIIGQHSKVGERLKYVTLTVIDDTGVVHGGSSGFVSAGTNTITFTAPSVEGNYQARFEFYDSDLVPDYSYIHDLPFMVSATAGSAIIPGTLPTTEGILGWLNSLLDSWGMNNTAGHWMIILGLCVLWAALFGVFGKMPLVATVLCVLTFGLGIYIGWVDKWIIALLSIAAGFVIYKMFKKNTAAGES
jgi:hypothetical protein